MSDEPEDARIIRELDRTGDGTDPFASAVRATRMPMLVTDPQQDDNPIVFVNASFLHLTGYDRAEVMGRNCRFLQGPDTDRTDVQRLRDAIAAREAIEVDLLNYRKDGAPFWNRLLASPVFNEDGDLSYFVASCVDITAEREKLALLEHERRELQEEVNRRNAELIASEERLRFALKAGQMGSWSLDIPTQQLTASDGCKQNFGRPISEPFSYEDLMNAVHPNDRAKRDEAVSLAIASGSFLDVEYRLITPDGDERWVQVRGQTEYDTDGAPSVMIGISQVITDRKREEEHRALLANELGHRVKNSLAMIQAMVSQTLRRAESISDAEQVLQARIMAMASANDVLVSTSWESADLRDMLEHTLAPFMTGDNSQFDLSGPEAILPPKVANSFALGIHELATNAVKYGALSTEEGRVRIAWDILDETMKPVVRLLWQETGGPPVSKPQRNGFGTRLIERVMVGEAGGSAKIDYQTEGVFLEIKLPLN